MPDKALKFNAEIAKFTPRQMEAVRHLCSGTIKFLLYGGALGGGKSYLLRWYCLRFLLDVFKRGFKHVTVMLACEDYPSLKDRQLSKIGREFPEWIGIIKDDHKEYGKCFMLYPEYGSGVICFRNLDDPSKYQSAEFALICVDELTKNNYDTFTFLRTRLRWPGMKDIECQFVGGTNPGGIGHGWCKQLWIDRVFPPEFLQPTDYSSLFAYVPSKADDNPHLEPSYWLMLNTLPESLRAAFRDGSWTIFLGQVFAFNSTQHIIKPLPIPDYVQVYMTFDWGFGAPFSVGWWWVDADGRIYRCGEWYGWNGTPNHGERLTDPEIADGILEREKKLGLSTRRKNREIISLSDPTCFSKKPDYKGGGQGPSTAEEFSKKDIYLSKGDPSRILKIRQFHERLRIPKNGDKPMLQVYDTCTHFIRTIPDLVVDANNVEDVDTTGEDHVYDEACHICMARPLIMEKPKKKLSQAAKRIDALERGDIGPEMPLIWEEREIERFERQELIDESYEEEERSYDYDFGGRSL